MILFLKVKRIIKGKKIYLFMNNQNKIKPLEGTVTDNSLVKARKVKTQRIKETIKKSL